MSEDSRNSHWVGLQQSESLTCSWRRFLILFPCFYLLITKPPHTLGEELILDLPGGLSMIANQLSTGDNTLAAVIKGVPRGTTAFFFTNKSQKYESSVMLSDGWTPNLPVPPGTGFWLSLPRAQTIVLQGEPLSGSLTQLIGQGFSLPASKSFKAGLLASDLGFPAEEGDIIFKWSPLIQAFETPFHYEFGGWSPREP